MRVLAIMTKDREQLAAHQPAPEDYERMDTFITELRERGALIDTGGAIPGSFECRITRNGGRDAITDGPFTESKEVVGGFALFEVSGRDEVLAITKQFLDLVGDGTCELHEVTSA